MRRSKRGFTLVELLIVVVIMGMVGIYFGQGLDANERAYQAVDQTVESQQILRSVVDLIERDIRHAGLMMPESVGVCGVDDTTGPDTLYLADGAAIDPQDDSQPYDGATVTAGGLGGGTQTLTLDSLVIEPGAPARPAYDTDGNGVNDSDFRVGGGVILARSDPTFGNVCGRVVAVRPALNEIDIQIVSNLAPPIAGAVLPLIAVPANEYRLNGTDLIWNGNLLAGNVEDMQFSWVFDPNGNNVVDAGEVYGAQGGTAYLASGNTLGTDYENGEDIREIRASFVARARREDDAFTRGRPQALENRDGSTFTNDGFRRRVIMTRVRLRNIGTRIEAS